MAVPQPWVGLCVRIMPGIWKLHWDFMVSYLDKNNIEEVCEKELDQFLLILG